VWAAAAAAAAKETINQIGGGGGCGTTAAAAAVSRERPKAIGDQLGGVAAAAPWWRSVGGRSHSIGGRWPARRFVVHDKFLSWFVVFCRE